MELKNSLEFIYEKCAFRIKEQKNKLDITALEIYPSDDKMISKITNNKRTKNNRFLITDRVLECYSKDNKEKYGIVSKLNFNSKSEVLWGDKEEIEKYLQDLFSMIFNDLLENFDKNELETFFLDYVPYAKYTALNKLLEGKEMAEKEKRKKVTETNREMKLFSFMMAYGISEDDVIVNYYNYYENKEEIIDYLFLICYKNFKDIFLKFIDNTDSFHKIDKKFSDFVYGSFILMLEKTTDEKISLGKRVYNLILNDMSMSEKLLSNENICNSDTNLMRNRIRVSSRYITELEILQKSEIEMLRLKG
ncbi:hypothetical protein [Thomasclavelia ramosa]|uniref:hypothetical protein n=1 Tax=Thomasclavelia ramosa TaxID=1547 RepID=UPI000243130E|nr:hypothetical protein [Thomasclavelia ramosa]EHM87621.1 hypothetical protein HMPREF1021_03860 [Coprobacillus sp. 3_3_56FAA]MCR1956570.1 hypothetical protein [Thomasclavelia ramosa]QQV05933.1 hypothetical protein I6I62_16240 [Thomasclavelia ramosa]